MYCSASNRTILWVLLSYGWWYCVVVFFFSSRRRHTRFDCDWSSDVCSSDLDEVAAGRDLDAVAGRLVPVQEEALRDRVLGWGELDVDAAVQEEVRRPQHLLARVHPEGQVVEAAPRAVGVRGVDQLVGGDAGAHPGARLAAVVQPDHLVQAVADP